MEFGIFDCFMIAFVCGLVFGLVYELLRSVRRLFDHRIIIFICDVSFFIVAGFFVFQLSMYLGNYIRLYTLLGFAAGLFAYIQTVGRLLGGIIIVLIRGLKAVFGKVFTAVGGVFKRSVGVFAHNVSAAFVRFNDFLKRKKKTSVPLLHFDTKRVYNVKRNIIQSGEDIGGKYVIQAKIRRSP